MLTAAAKTHPNLNLKQSLTLAFQPDRNSQTAPYTSEDKTHPQNVLSMAVKSSHTLTQTITV